MALGYLTSKATAKLTKTQLNIPLILTLSIIPDADILLHGILEHRGPAHSIIIALLSSTPFFILYRARLDNRTSEIMVRVDSKLPRFLCWID
jgi:membrane-bound metal-dependent hydrolase YbcI (DUF457 family)